MAASIMMETLKQIQSDLKDQKEYMRNFHDILTEGKIISDRNITLIEHINNKNINEKYDLIEEKISDLHKKIDKQQLTIERLEQHVKKNNMLLFGNDDTEINVENNSIMLKKTDHNEKEIQHNDDATAIVEISDNFIDNTESNQPQNIIKADTEETLRNGKDDSRHNDQLQEKNNAEHKDELTSNDIRELKELVKEYVSTRKTSTEETRPVHKQKIVRISPTFFTEDQISKLNEELERISEKYRSTDIFPIIKVVPGPHLEHSVIKKLRKGVIYESYDTKNAFAIKLGRDGYKESEIRELLKDYPDLILFDVVRELLKSRSLWSGLNQKIDFLNPKPYDFVL